MALFWVFANGKKKHTLLRSGKVEKRKKKVELLFFPARIKEKKVDFCVICYWWESNGESLTIIVSMNSKNLDKNFTFSVF